jgi:hypothetical protein
MRAMTRTKFMKFLEEKCRGDPYFQIEVSIKDLKKFDLNGYFENITSIIETNGWLITREQKKLLHTIERYNPEHDCLTLEDYQEFKKTGNIVFGFSCQEGYLDYYPELARGYGFEKSRPYYLVEDPTNEQKWDREFFDDHPVSFLENFKKLLKGNYKEIRRY